MMQLLRNLRVAGLGPKCRYAGTQWSGQSISYLLSAYYLQKQWKASQGRQETKGRKVGDSGDMSEYSGIGNQKEL